ncbi:TetR family transcriptional regulator [Streptomyces chartreusis]|uniref:TetR family transcriptional regulator n=1 Tax=Streptomyces chartreusis TaxID=1969 RepID=UPI0036A61F5F
MAEPELTPRPGDDGRVERGAESRRRILQAAAELIAERDLASTTLQDIADRAGVSKSRINYHFPTKLHIAEVVLNMGWVTMMGATDHNDPNRHLQLLIDAGLPLAILTVEVPVIRAANRLSTGHEGDPFFGRQQGYYIPVIKKVLEDAQAAGQLRPGVECEAAAKLVVQGYTGTEILARAHPETLPRQIDELIQTFVRGIATPETLEKLDFSMERAHRLAELNPLLHEAREEAAQRAAEQTAV